MASSTSFDLRRIAAAVAAAAVMTAAHTQAAEVATTWIECEGQMVINRDVAGQIQSETQPARHVFFFEDELGNLYQYFESTKNAGRQPVVSFDQQAIKWVAASYRNREDLPAWEGQLDRNTLALTMVRREGNETVNWTEQCKPTTPREVNAY